MLLSFHMTSDCNSQPFCCYWLQLIQLMALCWQEKERHSPLKIAAAICLGHHCRAHALQANAPCNSLDAQVALTWLQKPRGLGLDGKLAAALFAAVAFLLKVSLLLLLGPWTNN